MVEYSLNKSAKATLAQAAGTYLEQPVAGPLGAYFGSMWLHSLPTAEVAPIVVVPDGCIDLQLIDGVLRVAGPDREAQTESFSPGTTILGLRFLPTRAPAWLGLPASEILNQRVPLEDLLGAKARRLSDDLGGAREPAELAQRLEKLIALRRPPPTRGRVDMYAAFELVSSGAPPGRPLIPWLLGKLAVSERTLRRRFDESFGYGPKTLDRILRFQRFLHLTRTRRGASGASLAAEAGYTDQAHLVRESRRLAGATPCEIAAAESRFPPT